jgi:small subunit ribosomal protein S21
MRQYRIKVIGGKIDNALRKMKKNQMEFGIIKEIKKRTFFEKPSLSKRKQMIEVIRKNKRNNENRQES